MSIHDANIKRMSEIFRVLANPNRLKIITVLSAGGEMNVGDISGRLKISFTSASNHLVMLKSMDVLDARGALGHVWYSLNKNMPKDFRAVIDLL